MSEEVVGIDLGTTHSLVGALVEGDAVLFAGPDGDELLPSVVGAEGDRVLVGRAARNRRLIDPRGTVVEVKREMGTRSRFRVGKREHSAPEVSALILSTLLDRAEAALGARPKRGIITVPAYFNEAERQATRDAGELAGLTVERLVNEPTAAALSMQSGQEQCVLVYDFGGGTLDCSILEMEEGLLEVRTSRGDTRLGGADIDRALVDWVLERLPNRSAERVRSDATAMTRLTEAVERAKIALSTKEKVTLQEPFLLGSKGEPVHLDLPLSRAELTTIARPFITKSLTCIDNALKDAGLAASDLDRVLLVGGTSLMPAVQELVQSHLGRPLVCDSENATRNVALGASILAGRAAGHDVDYVLVDVNPHTLSAGVLEVASDELVASPLISRDDVLPAEQTNRYYTTREDQEAVTIPVVQGEERWLEDNTLLGEVSIEDLPPGPAQAPVDVSFQLDISGVLQVKAVHVHSGLEATAVFKDHPTRLSKRAKKQSKDSLAKLELHEETSDEDELSLAQAMLTRAQHVLADAVEADEAAVTRARELTTQLETAIEQRASEARQLSDDLADALLDLS